MSVCGCDGSGTIEQDGKLVLCECYWVKQALKALPPDISRVDILPAHFELPFLKDNKGVRRMLYIRGAYQDIRAVIKTVVLFNPAKWVKIISDKDILNVYVGSMSKSQRPEDYTGPIYNNIQDLVEPPDLLIIHLGMVFNKNRAAAGALEESLAHRINAARPTWAFSTYEKPFSANDPSCSPGVEEILKNSMQTVDIPRICSQFTPASSPTENPFTPEPVSKRPTFEDKPRKFKPEIVDSSNPLSAYGSGVKKKKPFGRGDN
jgi:hypothetical protein